MPTPAMLVSKSLERSHIAWEKLVKNQSDGTDEESNEGKPMEPSASLVPRWGVPRGVTPEVLQPGHSVDSAQDGCNDGVLETTQEQDHKESWHELQTVLVSSLHTVEELRVLVLTFQSVHRGIEHSVFLASQPDLNSRSKYVNPGVCSWSQIRVKGLKNTFLKCKTDAVQNWLLRVPKNRWTKPSSCTQQRHRISRPRYLNTHPLH